MSDEEFKNSQEAQTYTVEVNDRILRRATKDLRVRLNLTQAAFGDKIGKTVPTILRYETQVSPKGQALIPYAELAITNKFFDLAEIFRTAILKDNGPALERVMNWNLSAAKPEARPRGGTLGASPAIVLEFLGASSENQLLLEGFCKFMSAKNLKPVEELVQKTIRQVILEQAGEAHVHPKKMA